MISVVLASYNGHKYIDEQLTSILNQIGSEDEVIVSDNGSEDGTIEIVSSILKHDSRVKLIHCIEKGPIANFENGILNSSGDYIFLSDQDDVWMPDKVYKVIQEFDKDTVLIEHNCEYDDENLNPLTAETFFDKRKPHVGFAYNWIRNGYQGSCICFKKEIVPFVCPIPRTISMHDQWIGILAEKRGKIKFLDENLIHFRRHGNNTSVSRVGIYKKAKYMYYFLVEYINRIRLNIQ